MSPGLGFLVGLVALVGGAELLVRGAARLASSWGISPLVIGLTIVAFGTSAPELAVSVGAALSGAGEVALGNVIGSNIANVLLILGLSALIAPLVVHEQVIRQEVPVMIAVTLVVVLLALDGALSRAEGSVLFALVLAYTAFLIHQARRSPSETSEFADEIPGSRWDRHWSIQLLLIVVGLALLVLGARWLVEAATAFARWLGVSELVIGLTVVAVGTSLPEIATSLVAALRGQRDIAVGNVVGSNTFNLLAVLGASAALAPAGLDVPAAVRSFDLWVMLAATFACLPVMLSGRTIARWEGAVFFAYYGAYVVTLVLAARQSPALTGYASAMLGYVAPLTVLTLLVSFMQRR